MHPSRLAAKDVRRIGLNRLADNVRQCWELCDMDTRRIGLTWYPEHAAWVESVARVYRIEQERLAFAVAALSPNLGWPVNQAVAVRVAEAYWLGGRHAVLALRHLPAYGNAVKKAGSILEHGQASVDWRRAPKTYSFGHLLADPLRPYVCIDSHVGRAMLRDWLPGTLKIDVAAYPILAEVLFDVADELGILPSVLQASLWALHIRLSARRDG